MTLMVDTSAVGLEQIQRAALFVLVDTLPAALSDVEDAWAASDESYATRLGLAYVPTLLETVGLTNFHEGHRPSLIDAPRNEYPNVCVMAYVGTPGAGSALLDHQEVFRVGLVIETMVKASEEEGEEVCNRRAQRMVEALHVCMMSNQTLGGIVSGFEGAPTTRVTELFTRKDRQSDSTGSSRGNRAAYGPTWLWQGGRLEYAVRKEASLPSHGSNFRAPTYEGLDIDQI